MFKKKSRYGVWAQIITMPFVCVAILLLVSQMLGYQEKNIDLQQENIEEIVEKYVIQCYATEGSYPPDLAYLEKNYGLIIDEEKYFYHYEVFASNIMPEVSVLLKEE